MLSLAASNKEVMVGSILPPCDREISPLNDVHEKCIRIELIHSYEYNGLNVEKMYIVHSP